MSARTTFEDRLLEELKRHIELREAGSCRTGPAEAAMDDGGRSEAADSAAGSGSADWSEAGTRRGRGKSPAGRLFAPRRLAVVAAACAAAWLGVAGVPGSPSGSTAYAVERHDDGSVTLTVREQSIDVGAQRELARKLRPWGIRVIVDVLSPGFVCQGSEVTPLVAIDRRGDRVPVIPVKSSWDITLHSGNVLAFENVRGDSRPRAVSVYEVTSEAEPCRPLKVTLPDA
ncbi:hypothetical protein FNH09_17600 [Streptomyces adustus]|uniref:Uncharacterized protein n=1 Tax=Streptomyces adustus TaxID=1609272 RepID=A0A5N8VDA9_9ACTN|nr:hypothetical protein [Streptomyces adustus]MPY33009.1 hypothetical protein [Streptomyces adustus]